MSDAAPSAIARRDLRVWVGVPALYLVLAIALTWPAASTLTTRLAGDYGDGFQNLWNYWWLKEALIHFKNPFFTDHLRHPFGVTLVFQTMVWPDAIVALPLWAVLPPLGVYNAVLLWSFILTGLGMYGLVQELGGHRPSSIFAGAVFMAVPFHMSHALGHQHLVSIGYLPIYLMFLHRIVKGGTLRDAALGGFALAAAALCSWYQLLFAFVWSLGVFGWAALHQRQALFSMAFVKRAFTLAGCFLLIAGPLLAAMAIKGHGEPLVGSHDARFYSADLESFFYPGGRMAWSSVSRRFMHWTGNNAENGDYLGYVLLLLAPIGLWKNPLARAYGVTGLVGGLLSMGPSLHIAGRLSHEGDMPYAWLVKLIPGLDFSGVPVRFGLLAQGSLVVMAALGLSELLRLRPRLGVVIPALAGAIAFVELWPVNLPTSVWPVPAPMAEWGKSPENFSVLDMTGDTRMLWNAIHHGKPCVGGYVTRSPKRLDDWWNAHPIFGQMDKRPSRLMERAQRDDAAISFNWGTGSPMEGVLPDFFEVRWAGEILAPQEGDYAFAVEADDGASLTIDGQRLVQATSHFTAGARVGRAHLTAGLHTVDVEYHELTGGAAVQIVWQGPGVERQVLSAAPNADGSPGHFHATFFDARPDLGVSQDQAQSLMRELSLRYVVLNADDTNKQQLFTAGVGMKPIWSGDGMLVLELPAH